MRSRSAKPCLTLATASLVLTLAVARAQAPAASKLAEQQYKNIKVLTGIPADQVIPAMQFITASLGVDCEYCHVRNGHEMAFDKDDKKPKVTARKMIQMVAAINKGNFEGKREVTCYSCHRGAADPVAIPIITDEEPKLEAAEKKPAEAPSAQPDAYEILDKYLAAVGGAASLQKVTTRVEKGTLTAFGGQHLPVDVYDKAPDKRISVMHFPNGDSITAFDGHSGWLTFPGRPPHIMTAEENASASMDADLYLPVHLKTMRQKFIAGPGDKIDGRDTIQVVGRSEGQPPLRLYFDPQSNLLLRLVRYTETPLGRLPTQIDYSDYRDADGLKVPFRWSLARPGNRFTIQVDQLQQNVPVDDAKFTPPPAPGPAPAGHQGP
jgi:photosynthetic reaction center cytochrome c subunit